MTGFKNMARFQPFTTGWLVWLVSCAAALAAAIPGRADMLVTRDRDQPVFGRYQGMDETGRTIFLAHPTDAAAGARLEIDPAQILSLTINIDSRRLELLDPVTPAGYRDYAEELAVQKADPEARELAIRLYLIVAVSGGENLRRSALAGLVPLARNDMEKEKFVTLQLLAGGTSRHVEDRSATDQPRAVSERTRRTLVELFRALRRQEKDLADDLLSIVKDDADSENLLIELGFPEDRLKTIAAGNDLPATTLLQLLKAERYLANPVGDGNLRDQDRATWAKLRSEAAVFPSQMPDPRTVTEFNPDENLYRNGRWTSNR